jgi:hypothetical protein
MAFTPDGKRQACQDTPPVNPDRASATGPLVASLLRTGEFEMLAECVEQTRPRLQIDQTLGSVDAKRNVRAGPPTLNLRGAAACHSGSLFGEVDSRSDRRCSNHPNA